MSGQVTLSQYDYLKKHYNGLPDDFKVDYTVNRYGTTAPADLFKTNEDSPLLDDASKETYH